MRRAIMVLSSLVVLMKGNADKYGKKYEKAVELHSKGFGVSQISEMLSLPYMTVYYWLKKGRKKSQSQRFFEFIRENGPLPVSKVKAEFPKHSDVFLKAVARGYAIRKHDSGIPGRFRFWYFVSGQENELEKRITGLRKSLSEAKQTIRDRLMRD